MTPEGDALVTIRRLSPPGDYRSELADDVRKGLGAERKSLPSKYFYDARGSELFEDITRLPEYYLTRAETAILERYATEIVASIQPTELVELGSGYSVKTKLLIDALHATGSGTRYVPMDISEEALTEAAHHLANYYPWLAIEGLVGDFFTDLEKVPRHGRRLVTFLGSTIGNFPTDVRIRFLRAVAAMLAPGDGLLLGLDLVKDVETLLAAYDDSAGVTEAFNKNILHVVNRELEADFPVDHFAYSATWDAEAECVAMGLVAQRNLVVTIGALSMQVEFAQGELLHNEVSCKFRRETIAAQLEAAGLTITDWWSDDQQRFAMAMARPREANGSGGLTADD